MKILLTTFGLSLTLLGSTTGQDNHPAINTPSKFAWDLFVELSHPGDLDNRGSKHPRKEFGEEWPTIWETWKLATPEVFPPKGAEPKPWQDWSSHPGGKPKGNVWKSPPTRSSSTAEAAAEFQGDSALNKRMLSILKGVNAEFDPSNEAGNETRMNKAAFDFVVTNEFYYLQGQQKAHREGRRIEFPLEAKEIKARWRRLSAEETKDHNAALKEGRPPRFHVAILEDGVHFGLIALHITTKDLPNWFWATFEHVDNPPVESPSRFDIHFDNYGQFPPLGNTVPKELGGTKWANYRLRGAQIDFVDPTGQATILANSVIEGGFQKTSSCISCHARATINDEGQRLPVFEKVEIHALDRRLADDHPDQKSQLYLFGSLGAPNPSLFHEQGTRRFTQTDFVWSMFRAEPRPEEGE